MRPSLPCCLSHIAGIGLWVLAGDPCHSAPVSRGETLRQALARTYLSNPTLSAERARQRSDDENVPRALSGYFPTVSGSIEGGPNVSISRPGNQLSSSSPVTIGITVNQNIYDAGRTAFSVRSAESGVFAGRATLRGVEQDVLLSAVTAYMDVLRDSALIELQRNNIEFLREIVRVTRRRFETGDVSQTDPAQAESRLARGEADLASALANLATSRATYRQVIGTAPERLVFPDESESVVKLTPAAAISYAFRNHPAIRAAMHALDMAASDVRVIATDLLPTVGVQGTAGRTFGVGRDADQPALPSVAAQVNVPIYDGGETYARVRQAKEVVAQRRTELEAAREQVRLDLRTALGALDAARAAIPAGEAAVAANETALAGLRREAQEGQRTTLDVLNAQQELLNARTNLLTARRDRIVAGYGVLAASGRLESRSLGLAAPLYRPERHFEQVANKRWGVRTPDGR